jgi:probable metal-binding protein
MNQIHGHEVIKMMLSSGKSYTKASLAEEIVCKFGAEARFFTCSAENLGPAELVDFLDAKGKLVPAIGGGFGISQDMMCGH